MLSQRNDPIIALATPPGRGAVGIVRLSGKHLLNFAQKLTHRQLTPRVAQLVTIKDQLGDSLDQVLAIFFPAPHSYTGEDVLELQGHGGAVVLQMLLQNCLQTAHQKNTDEVALLPHLRLARPGEYTERAYLNHKLDLAQAEAVADLIDANTEAAVRSAGRSLEGVFSKQVNTLKDMLIHLRMQIEACLDFPDEDIDYIQQMHVNEQLRALEEKTKELLAQAAHGRLLRDGLKLVIAGQPNAGKSSLLNALSGADVAIVTAIAGTTRDVLTQSIQIQGVPVHVLDTAGLREYALADEVEQIGMARAWDQIGHADIVLLLNDLSRENQSDYASAQTRLRQDIEQALAPHTKLLIVNNKSDAMVPSLDLNSQALNISAKTGDGLDRLKVRIMDMAGWQAGHNEGVFTARTRHLDAIEAVLSHIQQATKFMKFAAVPLDLMAEECRLAQNHLSLLTGNFSADDLLGEIFSRFCIGK